MLFLSHQVFLSILLRCCHGNFSWKIAFAADKQTAFFSAAHMSIDCGKWNGIISNWSAGIELEFGGQMKVVVRFAIKSIELERLSSSCLLAWLVVVVVVAELFIAKAGSAKRAATRHYVLCICLLMIVLKWFCFFDSDIFSSFFSLPQRECITHQQHGWYQHRTKKLKKYISKKNAILRD